MNESKPNSGWNEAKPSFTVNEAMKYATKEKGFWSGEVHTVIDTLAAEVERLRAELATVKAASVCPVKVLNIWEGTYESDRYIELRTDEEADKFTDWLRERMKDKLPPAL